MKHYNFLNDDDVDKRRALVLPSLFFFAIYNFFGLILFLF